MFEEQVNTIAQVAMTMAGFSGVAYALRNRAGRRLDEREKFGVLHILLPSFGAVIISLIAITLLNSDLSTTVAWRTSCAIAGIYVIIGASTSTLDTIRGKNSWPTIVAWPTNIVGEIFGILNVLIALGMFSGYAEVACVSILIWVLFVSMISFVSLLTEEHADS